MLSFRDGESVCFDAKQLLSDSFLFSLQLVNVELFFFLQFDARFFILGYFYDLLDLGHVNLEFCKQF